MSELEVTISRGRPEVLMTREFDAPRALVFRAYTDPDLIPRWWGPRYLTTTVDRMEVRPGGSWRFVQRAPDGTVHAFHGVYHLVEPPERIVQTFEYEGEPGHVLLETVTFVDVGGRTRLTTQSIYQSLEDRDGMVASGMESGVVKSMDRLEELLARQ